MSITDQSRRVARRFLQAFAAGDVAVLEQIVAEGVDHNTPPGTTQGRRGLLEAVATYRAGFPDLAIAVEREVAEADFVVVYGTVTGTNTGPMMGAPATSKRDRFA